MQIPKLLCSLTLAIGAFAADPGVWKVAPPPPASWQRDRVKDLAARRKALMDQIGDRAVLILYAAEPRNYCAVPVRIIDYSRAVRISRKAIEKRNRAPLRREVLGMLERQIDEPPLYGPQQAVETEIDHASRNAQCKPNRIPFALGKRLALGKPRRPELPGRRKPGGLGQAAGDGGLQFHRFHAGVRACRAISMLHPVPVRGA